MRFFFFFPTTAQRLGGSGSDGISCLNTVVFSSCSQPNGWEPKTKNQQSSRGRESLTRSVPSRKWHGNSFSSASFLANRSQTCLYPPGPYGRRPRAAVKLSSRCKSVAFKKTRARARKSIREKPRTNGRLLLQSYAPHTGGGTGGGTHP